MSSKSEVRDPVTGASIKKDTKTLMVEIAARRVEDGQCVFPRLEDVKTGLVHQLRNYEVIRVSEAGRPIYTKSDEHTAIAWMLGIFAFMMEFTSLARANVVTQTASIPEFTLVSEDDISPNRSSFDTPSRTVHMQSANPRQTLEDSFVKRSNIGGGRSKPRTRKQLRRSFGTDKRSTF